MINDIPFKVNEDPPCLFMGVCNGINSIQLIDFFSVGG